jgi:ribulose-phosphate 3-epimerase
MVQIAPSLLSADFARLGQAVEDLTRAGADMIHIDVMDGNFVPNITMGPAVVAALRPLTALPLDVHLMVREPARQAEAFAAAGADYISVHVEADPHLHRTLSRIAQLGKKPGLALNPHTPVAAVLPVLYLCQLVLLMSVNPGFAGQEFIPATLDKISELRKYLDRNRSDALLEVDGGINAHTAPAVKQAGAGLLVAGSAVFGHPRGLAAAIAGLRGA